MATQASLPRMAEWFPNRDGTSGWERQAVQDECCTDKQNYILFPIQIVLPIKT